MSFFDAGKKATVEILRHVRLGESERERNTWMNLVENAARFTQACYALRYKWHWYWRVRPKDMLQHLIRTL